MSRIVITDWGFPSLEPEHEVFRGKDVKIEAFQCKTEEDVVKVVADADVVMAQWAPVREKAIGSMKKCRGIVRYGIGLDNIDLEAARKRGIQVRNVPDYCLDEVADHTLALMLAVQRQVTAVAARVKQGVWSITPPVSLSPLRSSTLGLVGFGRIARLVAQRAAAFGMKIMAFDPLVPVGEMKAAAVESSDLEGIFRNADIISLHCPLTESTRHLINEAAIGQMRPHVILINTSRGGLVDLDAVTAALKGGRIAGAGMDVFEKEPLPADHPFLGLPQALATSHIAWFSSASIGQLQRRAAQQALELLATQGEQR